MTTQPITSLDFTAPRLDAALLPALHLGEGAHDSRDKGLCVMEAVAWFAGEEHSDAPDCACPVIAAYARRMNDRFDQPFRDALRERIPRFVGSKASEAVMIRRRDEIAFRGITIMLPYILDRLVELGARRFPDTAERTWNAQIAARATELRALTREQGITEWRAAAQRTRATTSDASASAYASAYAKGRQEIRDAVKVHALATLDAILDIRE